MERYGNHNAVNTHLANGGTIHTAPWGNEHYQEIQDIISKHRNTNPTQRMSTEEKNKTRCDWCGTSVFSSGGVIHKGELVCDDCDALSEAIGIKELVERIRADERKMIVELLKEKKLSHCGKKNCDQGHCATRHTRKVVCDDLITYLTPHNV